MFNLWDIFAKQQGGDALDRLARQFSLTPDQATQAVQAMMPAFAAALQKQMTDPNAWTALFGLMAQRAAVPDAMSAFAPGNPLGQEAIDRLFGSPDVAKAVAAQIAGMTGLGPDALAGMMPGVAATLMSGLGQAMQGNPMAGAMAAWASPGGAAQHPFAAMMKTLTDAGAAPQAAFTQALQHMIRSMPRPTGETETFEAMLKRVPNPAGPASAFDDTIGEFVRGFNRGRPEPKTAPEQDLADMFGQMFQAGANAQAGQVQAFGEMLDRMWKKK